MNAVITPSSPDITLPSPSWNSSLARVILELEKLRQKGLYSNVPHYIFLQLKDIFQVIETLGSARIEGNNTTLSEYVEKLLEGRAGADEKQRELSNIEKAIKFIEAHTKPKTVIDRAYLSELHKIVTDDLTPPPQGEGSKHPGMLRPVNVSIVQSGHVPPKVEVLAERFEGFIQFINDEHLEQNQLLMVAVAHHRFMHIHPYDNGNGRVGRLLNYALLLKLGFNVDAGGRIFNPSSVFYADRDQYYQMLGDADSLTESSQLVWAEYFLSGLRDQIKKIDHLMDGQYTRNQILLPMLEHALERQYITKQENDILTHLVKQKNMAMKAADLDQFGFEGANQKSYVMGKLRDKKMVMATKTNGRTYTIRFANNYLLRSVMKTLEDQGFIADFLNQN